MLTQKFKAHVSEFTFRLGPIQTTGKLIGVRAPQPKAAKTNIVTCTPDGKGVKQVYVDKENTGGTQYTMGELSRAILNEDGSLTMISKDAIAAAKECDIAENTIAVTVHPAEQINSSLFPSDDNAYVFEPADKDPVNVQWYSLLYAAVVGNPDKAFVGSANVRNNEGLYRLTIWRDRLVLQRMLYPEEVNDHAALDVDPIDESIAAKFATQLNKLTTDFDATEYRDTQKERLAAVAKVFTDGGDITVVPKSKKADFDIMDALDAFDG